MLTLVLAAICLSLTIAGPASAAIPRAAIYNVQIQGAVNGLPFARSGGLAIDQTVTRATSNGVNPVDLCLASGSPFINPERGAIWFATNGICVNANGALQDMAFVSANPAASTVAVRPDPGISATGINGFNGSSGFTAAVWQIFDGSMVLRFQGQGETVTGELSLLGTGAIFHSENTYVATLTGQATQLTPGAPGADVEDACAKAREKVRKARDRLKDANTANAERKAKRKLRKAKRRKKRACGGDAAGRDMLRFEAID